MSPAARTRSDSWPGRPGGAGFRAWVAAGLALLGAVIRGVGAPNDSQVAFFEERVRPFLVTECRECHGSGRQRGGLRVDSREALLRGGDSGPAVLPGRALESRLFLAVSHAGPDLAMPKDRPRLAGAVLRDIARWIDEGAVFPAGSAPVPGSSEHPSGWAKVFESRRQWWSLRPPVDPPIPAPRDPDDAEDAVDRLVFARLEAEGLRASPPAPPPVWLRRVHGVLTGLPPDPAQLAAFGTDPSMEARARVVDGLLASPAFGERWARHWMDLVRFADSYGHEQDYPIPHAWRYRDYLIRAFNADVPYGRFVQEHLAGDLLPDPRRDPVSGHDESVLATGFWYLHQATHAPVDPLQDEADRIDNQIDVFSKTFLGLTVACARCHDHKFDAISTRDYYSLAAFLRSSRQDIASIDPDGSLGSRLESLVQHHHVLSRSLRPAIRAALGHGSPKVAPYLESAVGLVRAGIPTNAWSGRVAGAARDLKLDAGILERWTTEVRAASATGSQHPLRPWLPPAAEGGAAAPAPAPTPALTRTPADRSTPDWTLRADDAGWMPSGQGFRPPPTGHGDQGTWRVGSLGLEHLATGLAHSGRWAGRLQGALRSPTFTLTHDHLHLHLAGRGSRVRLVIARYGLREFNPLLFEATQLDVDTGGDLAWRSITSGLRRHRGRLAYLELLDDGDGFIALDRVVSSDDPSPPSPPAHPPGPADGGGAPRPIGLEQAVHAGLRSWADDAPGGPGLNLASGLWRRGLLDWGASGEPAAAEVARIRSMATNLPAPIRALAMTDGSVEPARILVRGDPKSPGEPVPRRFLEALAGPGPMTIARGSGRLEWARAVTSPTNPLLHRVIVNRVWAHLFGRGLVETVDNFGALGTPPSHPELLDHLAVGFARDGGSLKRLIRRLCLTRTFGQASEASDARAEAADPSNRLLHRQNLRRLEGEALRDALLATAGNLDRRRFGPAVPTHMTPFMGDRMWVRNANGPLDGDRRRSVYQETRRNFLSPLFVTFDLPIPESTVGRRNGSNVPAQALALMNDPFVRQQATAWAHEVIAGDPGPVADPRERIGRLHRRAFGRDPAPAETRAMLDLLAGTEPEAGSSGSDAEAEVRRWTELCHAIFLTQEFTHVP